MNTTKPDGNNLSNWAIGRPLPALMIFFVLCVAGVWGFLKLPVARFPDISFPMTVVSITQPGAAPSQMETEVTRRVEDSVATIPGVKRILSSVSEGSSTTSIEFNLDTDLATALDDTRDAITRIRMDMPQDIQEPVVGKVEIGGSLMTVAVAGSGMSDEALSWFVDRDVSKALYGVPGVARVVRIGGVDRAVRVDLRPDALLAYGTTAGEVSSQLARIQVERPGGKTQLGGQQQQVRTVGTVQTAAGLSDYSITLPGGRSVRLGDLATVEDAASDPTAAALLDGKRVVGFSLSRARGADELKVAKGVQAKLRELARGTGVRFSVITDNTQETRGSYESSMTMLYEGSLLAIFVVWLFLRDWRATWISAVALPLSIIPTFAVMHLFGFSLNIITLLALAVVVGILVDDAIVEIENIVRHLRMGKPPLEAARAAAGEIGTAVIATSMTLAAVFVPVAFMPGIAGKFFREFGWTAATAVMFSLLVARLLTPMMAAYQLKAHPVKQRSSRLMVRYLGWVEWVLLHKARTLWLALALFVASMGLVPFIPTTFIPIADLGRSNLNLELPPGATLDSTIATSEQARKRLAGIPELGSVFAMVGSTLDIGDPNKSGLAEPRKATLVLDWGPSGERSRSQKDLERVVRAQLEDLPGVRVSFVSTEPGEMLQLVLAGDDPSALSAAADQLDTQLRTIPGLGSISSSAALLRPEMVITPDPAAAASLGVSTEDIATAARIATSGDYAQRLAKLNLPERQIPIRVGFAQADLSHAGLLETLRVRGKDGVMVPLGSVATIKAASGPAVLSRYARQRNITFTAELNGRPLGEVMKQVQALPVVLTPPPGVSFINSGDAEVFVELFTGFALAMAAGIGAIYMVLLLLFNHPLRPLTILTAVPLSAGGAFGALLLTQNMLSLPALIGLLMLIGIASKNSILLVDYAVMAEDEQGMSQHDAIIDACRKRAQPIIMTTLAMGAGMLPIALGWAGDASFRAPMAIAVIGGLMTSTLLSLLVVPAAYAVLDGKRKPRRAVR